jgi:AraC-like DNA-binding protein
MKKTSSLVLPLLLFFVGASLFFLVLSDRFTGFAVSELVRFNRGLADLTSANLDLLVERLKAFALARIDDPDLKSWLAGDRSDPVADFQAELALRQALASEPFLAGALLLAPAQGYLLDSRSRRWAWDDYPNPDLLKAVEVAGPYLRLVGARGDLALPFPLSQPATADRRTVVFLINVALVEQLVLQSSVRASFDAFVVDRQGHVVVGHSPGEGPWNDVVASPEVRKNVASQVWIFASRPLQREDWVLVRGVRLEELGEKASLFQTLLVAVLGALLVLYWIGLRWSQSRLTRPFRSLAEEHRALVRQEALRTLLASETLAAHETALVRQDTGLDVELPFTLLAARLEDPLRAIPTGRRAALDTWNAWCRSQGWVALGVDPGGDTLFLLLQLRGRAVQGFETLLAQLPDPGVGPIAWAAEEVAPGIDRLRFAVDTLRELTFLKFLTGEDKVYREADMARTLDRQPAHAVQDEADALSQAVRSGSPATLDHALAGLVESWRFLPYAECRLRLIMAAFLLFREFTPQVADGFQGLERTLGGFSTLGEAAGWLKDRLSELQGRLATPAQGAKRQQMLAQVDALLQEELSDFTLNLDRVAAHVGLSSGYLRQAFKEARGVTLSDHLHRLRIERIKELLEHSDRPVSRLIERSGFQTKSHFYSAFKEATGLTPDQYRRSKRQQL